MNPVKRYLVWAKPYWWRIGFIIFLGTLQFVSPLTIPLLVQIIIDETLLGEGKYSLLQIVVFMAVVTSFGVVVNFIRNFFTAITGNKMMMRLRDQLYEHLQKMPVSFYDQRQVGGVTSRVTHDVAGAQNLIGGGVINLVLDLFLIIFASVLLFRMNVTLAFVALSVLPLYYLAFTNLNVQIRLSWRAVHRQMERISGTLVERISAVRIVQAFNGEKREKIRFEKQTKQHFHHTVKAHIFSNILGRLSESFAHTGAILIWLVGGTMVLNGEMKLGEIIAFHLLISHLYGPIQRFADVNVTIQNSITNIERIFEIFDEKPSIIDSDSALPMPECEGHIVFNHVSYKYVTRNVIFKNHLNQPLDQDLVVKENPTKRFYLLPSSMPPNRPKIELEERVGIHGISFEARKGEVIALVGPSGAGKSTLINLIPRFYDPIEGSITIDGVNIRDYRIDDLRRHMALVLQENILFSGTIRENLLYGRENATEEEMIAAAEAANAHDFIAEFKDGYETMIGERGLRLSGGQKQRVAIARALLKNPKILILDEATSALDSDSEALVTEALERLMAGRTTFVIAHRLATVVRADQILVINEGRIQQRGSHRSLLVEGGLYRQLYEKQLKAMRPEDMTVSMDH